MTDTIRRRLRRLAAAAAAPALSAMLLTGCVQGHSNDSAYASAQVSSAASSPASSSSSAPSSAVSSASSSESAPDPAYAQAYADYAQDKYDAAVALCDAQLAKNPSCTWAYNIKGIALYFANGNSSAQNSLTLIDKAIALDPNYAYAYFNEALIYKGLKQYDASIERFNKDLALKPNDQWAYFGIATIYADQNDLSNTLVYLKKSIDIDASVKETARTESHFQRFKNNADFKALVQ